MYLKRLALAGFKTFPDPVEFDFDPGTTAIVGPNGCGKSNIVDAFKWVLGERSAKGMRGTEMLDVIFKGSRVRPALSRAEVTLTFDNEDGVLPIEASEVAITRQLLRDGSSDYMINRTRCRLKDILALFSDTGIGTSGYSVMEQGKIEAFLNTNPVERRRIFEEAAGISRFKKQRSEALLRLEKTEHELVRTGDQLNEIERRIRSLKIQAGKARRYVEDRELLRRISAVTASAEIEELQIKRQALTFRLSWKQTLRSILGALISTLEEKGEQARLVVDSARAEVDKVRGEETEIRIELEGVQQRVLSISDQISQIELRDEDRGEQLIKLSESTKEYENSRTVVREEIREEISQLRSVRRQYVDAESRRSLLQCELQELDKNLQEAKESALAKVFEETRLQNTRGSIESDHRGQRNLIERRKGEIFEFSQQILELQKSVTDFQQQREICLSNSAALDRRGDRLRGEVEDRTVELDETLGLLAEMRVDAERFRARRSFLEELERKQEGVGKGVRRLLATEAPIRRDFAGLLASLIEATPEVAPLVDAVLGSVLETLVIRGTTPLVDRIRILEAELSGESATVVQVDGLGDQVSVTPEIPEGATRLSSLVECEPVYRPLIDELLGSTLVTDDLVTGVKLQRAAPSFRIVTVDGTVIEPWGAVVLSGKSSEGLVSRRIEIREITENLERTEAHLDQVTAEGHALEGTIGARRVELERLQEASQRSRLEAEGIGRHIAQNDDSRCRITDRKAVVETEISQAQALISSLEEKLHVTDGALLKVLQERDQLDEQVAAFESRIGPLEEKLRELEDSSHALRLGATKSEERIASRWREQIRIDGEIEERQSRVTHLREASDRDLQRKQDLISSLEELGLRKETLEERFSTMTVRLDEAREVLEERRKEQRQLENQTRLSRKESELLRDGREEDLLGENECRVRIEGLRDRILEEFEIDLSTAPISQWKKELSVEGEEDEATTLQRLRSDLPRIQERMRRNSNVNLQAVEELDGEETRFTQVSNEVSDISRAKDLLLESIETLNHQSRERFLETFEEVRANLKEIFATMFGGGVADLILEEGVDVLEAGIDVFARPPGKRVSKLRLLSGGERALTAVSVLFALFKAKPSPFCILDEVDAPLDERNTRQFTRILKEFAKDSQFLIITHSRVTMAEAERLYGVTMEEEGVSKRVVVQIEEVDRFIPEKSDAKTDTTASGEGGDGRSPNRIENILGNEDELASEAATTPTS